MNAKGLLIILGTLAFFSIVYFFQHQSLAQALATGCFPGSNLNVGNHIAHSATCLKSEPKAFGFMVFLKRVIIFIVEAPIFIAILTVSIWVLCNVCSGIKWITSSLKMRGNNKKYKKHKRRTRK